MSRRSLGSLPVAVIGAGPVGLAAAAHLLNCGLDTVVFEAAPHAGANVLEWGHVRLFSRWPQIIDRQAFQLLVAKGWRPPPETDHPTGLEVVERYLAPLASLDEMITRVRYRTRVVAVSRLGADKASDASRQEAPFLLRIETDGAEGDFLAQAVIDASGTWNHPNPLGGSGFPALGEHSAAARVAYRVPDVLGRDRRRYAGRRVLVAGAGHSAFNLLLDLARLRLAAPETEITWLLRRTSLDTVLPTREGDDLVARRQLHERVRELLAKDAVRVVMGFRVSAVRPTRDGVVLLDREQELPEVDEVIAATGFRPDLGLARELRLCLDEALECPAKLAPLIDPRLHSCASVPQHGAAELAHPESGFYIVGMKSYGRAPTFLLSTGYEQVRSVVVALADDHRVSAVPPMPTGLGGCVPRAGACGPLTEACSE
jgi:flavin-dependent dehydrogenase